MAYKSVTEEVDNSQRPVVNYKKLGSLDSYYHSFDPCDYDAPDDDDGWEDVGQSEVCVVRSVSPGTEGEVLVLIDEYLVKLEDLKDLIADVDGSV